MTETTPNEQAASTAYVPGDMLPAKAINHIAYVPHVNPTVPPMSSIPTVSTTVVQLASMFFTVLPAKRGKGPRASIRSTYGNGGDSDGGN